MCHDYDLLEPKRSKICALLKRNLVLLVSLLLGISLLVAFVLVLYFYGGTTENKRVILISMDGFRHDYLRVVKRRYGINSLPNFDKFIASGVHIRQSINGYPTITLPNHQLLVTGLYPETTGVVANVVKDARLNKTLNMGQESLNFDEWITEDPLKYPIWRQAMDKKIKVGSMLWPLTDNFIGGEMPDLQVPQYTLLDSMSVRMSYEKRVDTVLYWMAKRKVDFVMLYFDEPDESGHAYGPESKEVADIIVHLDKVIGRLVDGLEKEKIPANIILTADHGMTQLSSHRMIHINDCIDKDTYSYTWATTSAFLYVEKEYMNEVYQNLTTCSPHMSVYKTKDVPAVEHFNIHSDRMPDLVIICEPRWTVSTSSDKKLHLQGNHGYSTTFDEMHPFLAFNGPDFLKGKELDRMNATDIYSIMCYLLGLTPHPNNGSLSLAQEHLLQRKN